MAAALTLPPRTIRRVIDGDRSLSWELAAQLVAHNYADANWLLCGAKMQSGAAGFSGVAVRSIYPVICPAVIPPVSSQPSSPAADNTAPPSVEQIAQRIYSAQIAGSARTLFVDAHFIKSDAANIARDLMRAGHISSLAFDGSALLADLAAARLRNADLGVQMVGSVAETAFFAAATGCGLGEAVGRSWWAKNDDISASLLAAAYSLNIPVTAHYSPFNFATAGAATNLCGAALGAALYVDFLVFAAQINHAAGNIFINGAQTTDLGWQLRAAAQCSAAAGAPVYAGYTIDCAPCLTSIQSQRHGQSINAHLIGDIALTILELKNSCKAVFGGRKV